MMSDEEKRGTKYIRHQPCYRSDRFNSFMQKLDERNEKESLHARFIREIGSPVEKQIPPNAKPWMLWSADNADNTESGTVNSNEDEFESNPYNDPDENELVGIVANPADEDSDTLLNYYI